MITENDIHQLMSNPHVCKAVSLVHPFARHERVLSVVSSAPNCGEMALASWIAVHTKIFIKARGGASNPMIEKIWKFDRDGADVDFRIGIKGAYKKYKVITSMTGDSSSRLRIVTWNVQGKEECEWERYGSWYGGNGKARIDTLPPN